MSLKLRKIQESDLQDIIKWRTNPEVTRYMYTDPVLDMDTQRKWLKKINSTDDNLYWIIEIDNVSIGVISINKIDELNKKCTWGYYIGNTSFRGRGIARSLECNIYDYVFDKLKLNKLCSEVFEFNDKVVKIHEKFGSEIEGMLKDHIFKNGQFYNVVTMGMLADKWHSIRDNYNYEKIYME